MTFTAAASVPPAVALISPVYSPSARQPVDAIAPQRGCAMSPFVYRGSNAADLPAPMLPRLMVVAVPPPSGVNLMLAVVAAVPVFCTTTVETRATPAVVLARSGAELDGAPSPSPMAEVAAVTG